MTLECLVSNPLRKKMFQIVDMFRLSGIHQYNPKIPLKLNEFESVIYKHK